MHDPDHFEYEPHGMETDDSSRPNSNPKYFFKGNPKRGEYETPLPPAQTLQSFIETTHKTGNGVSNITYSAHNSTMLYGYKYLIEKYQSRCYLSGGLNFKHKLKYVKDNFSKLTAHNIGKDLLKCIHANAPIIFIPLEIEYATQTSSHQNLLVYWPFKQIIERFEPGGLVGDEEIDRQLRKLFELTLRDELGEYTPIYVKPEYACPAHKVGLQELEMLSQFNIELEGGGYCQIWSLFLMESMLMNPELETSDIVEHCFSLSKSDPEYLRRMMRGYVQVISKAIQADSKFNIKSGLYENLSRDSDLQKDFKIQEALHRAAYQQTKRKSPLQRPKQTFRAKRRSPEGDESKVLNLIKGLPNRTQIKLFDVLEIDGKSTYDIESKIMKHVLGARISIADLRERLRTLEKAHKTFKHQQEEEVQEQLKETSPFILKMLADYYHVDDPNLVFDQMAKEETVTLKRFKTLVDKLLDKKYKDVRNSHRELRLRVDELNPDIATLVWTHLRGTGPYNPDGVFEHYVDHAGVAGLEDDVTMLKHARLLNLWKKK